MCTIPDIDAALRELRRVLKPGGELHFVEHGLAPDERVRAGSTASSRCRSALFGGCHLTRRRSSCCSGAGFEIVEVDRTTRRARRRRSGRTRSASPARRLGLTRSGISALIAGPALGGLSTSRRPSSAATRSASPRRPVPSAGSAPPTPSSATVTVARPLYAPHADGRVRGLRVLGHVRHGLGDDVVGGRLDGSRQALLRASPRSRPAPARASRATRAPGRRPRSVRTAGWMPRASSRSSSSPWASCSCAADSSSRARAPDPSRASRRPAAGRARPRRAAAARRRAGCARAGGARRRRPRRCGRARRRAARARRRWRSPARPARRSPRGAARRPPGASSDDRDPAASAPHSRPPTVDRSGHRGAVAALVQRLGERPAGARVLRPLRACRCAAPARPRCRRRGRSWSPTGSRSVPSSLQPPTTVAVRGPVVAHEARPVHARAAGRPPWSPARTRGSAAPRSATSVATLRSAACSPAAACALASAIDACVRSAVTAASSSDVSAEMAMNSCVASRLSVIDVAHERPVVLGRVPDRDRAHDQDRRRGAARAEPERRPQQHREHDVGDVALRRQRGQDDEQRPARPAPSASCRRPKPREAAGSPT